MSTGDVFGFPGGNQQVLPDHIDKAIKYLKSLNRHSTICSKSTRLLIFDLENQVL